MAKQGHWGLVILCLGIALLPLRLRDALRARLLDLHGRVHRLLAEEATAPASLDPDDSRVALLEAELTRVRRALAGAGTAQEVLRIDHQAELIPAEVVPLAGAADLVHRVALARGSQDGVRVGQPVLADGVLVGQVAQVAAGTCEVRLVRDPKFTIRASIVRGEGEVEGLLRGDGSGMLAFEPAIIDPTAPPPVLRAGEAVHCSRASILCGVPALLGVIHRVEEHPGAPLPRARVAPARDMTGVRQVVIVKVDEAAS